MDTQIITNSSIDDWETRTKQKLQAVQYAIEMQADATREHLTGVTRLLDDSTAIADHEKIARLTQENISLRAQVAELAELRAMRGVKLLLRLRALKRWT